MSSTMQAPDPVSFAPFDDPAWRAELAQLAESAREASRRWAADAELTARLAAQVPRARGDERGGTAWTSFLREVAVARRISDRGAAGEVLLAVALVGRHPRTMDLLRRGRMPLMAGRALVEECIGVDRAVADAVEAELAERACHLTPSRIRAAVREIELRLDGDAAADREAKAASARGVCLQAQRDGQATLVFCGPALPLVQWFESLSQQARAARAAGDNRGIDALRFDIAVVPPAPAEAPAAAVDAPAAPADVIGDRRCSRPVRAIVHVPVETALGFSNEPGWLDGYGWISAPRCRQLLPTAELRQACVSPTGQLVDLAESVVRPEPTPVGVRDALLAMATQPFDITDVAWRTEPRHDPSDALTTFVDLRDRFCDGPTGTRVPAARCERDHELRYPDGPTAAWNLTARATRTHVLKHRGWTPLRTPSSTLWFSPAGQIVEVERHQQPPPEVDPYATLPDPDALHAFEAELLRLPTIDDLAPFDEPPF